MVQEKGLTLSEAWDAAETETGVDFDATVEPVEAPPSTEVDAQVSPPEAESVEQPDSDASEDVSFETIDLYPSPDQPAVESEAQVDWNSVVDIPGIGLVPLRELRDGYLRQADYTRKTQAVAEQRRGLEDPDVQNAMDLYRMLREDPAGTIQRMASEVGLLDGDKPAVPQVDIDQIVAQKVQEALAPQYEAAQRQAATQQIANEFSRLESTYGMELSTDAKVRILDNAMKSPHRNLELTYLQMRQRMDQVKSERDRVKDSSSKVTRTAQPPTREVTERAKTLSEAYDRAVASISQH